MRNDSLKKLLSLLLCMVLTAALALTVCGCSDNDGGSADAEQPSQSEGVNDAEEPGDSAADATVLGEGEVEFTLSVIDGEGNETLFEIHTDAATVGEALLALELIAGEEGAYGLYVKTVNGITADYDTDGTYWAFYIDGEYAMTGVDATEITAGSTYTLKVEG